MKLTTLQSRILSRLTDGPHTFNGLLVAMGAKPDTLNRSIAGLLEAGIIERCEVGQAGGVRIIKESEE